MLDGYGKMDQIVSRYLELGQDAGAVTDHGNLIAHVPFDKAMRAARLKPLFGCEFYIVDDMTEKKSKHQPSLGADGAPHVTVIAQTQAGYQNMLKLSTLSWNQGFYYKPRIDWDCLRRHQEGLVVLSGCVGGYPSTLINGKGPEAAWSFLGARMNEIENLFVELIPEPGLGISHSSLPWLVKIARDLKLPMVLTSDAHFPRPEDHVAEDTMLCIGLGTTIKDPKRTLKLPDYQYYCSELELLDRAYQTMQGDWDADMQRDITIAIENTRLIANACEVEIPRVPQLLFPGIAKEEAPAVLWSKVTEGLAYRIAQGRVREADRQAYYDRALEEFQMLESKGFCDYILVLTDICRWAKAQNSLVMCRGSAGGCLLLYLLGCSETDSVLHDLDFSRFMDPSRNDPPDIDVDFETWMREHVYNYIAKKYGDDNVCQILALGLVRARVAVQDVASVHGIPRDQYAPLSAALDSKDDDVDKQLAGLTDPTALAVLEKYPVFRHIDGIVGQCRQTGVHAAGILISSRPITESIAVMHQPGKPRLSSVDKHGAQDVGFLKLDSLGVSAYDVLADAVRSIGANIEWLYSLGYETETRFSDPGVFHVAQSGKVAGVFQLDGAAMHVGHKIGLDVFEEIYAVSALCRPGAVQHVPTYARNKFDRPEFERFLTAVHPIAAEVVKKTYGILAYQEQVMKLCNKLGGLPMEKVQKLRKRIANASFHGKELGAEYGDHFIAGCLEKGCSEAEAAYWWDSIKAHGIYSFNKAHCVTYAIVGYWMLYMKAHYPDAYFASYLKHEGASSSSNPLLMKRLIREFRASGGRLSLLDPTMSKSSFSSTGANSIVGGWGNIVGIGEKQATVIEKAGPYRSWEDVRAKLPTGLYYKLHEAGLTGAMPYNQQAAIELAPWMPVVATGPLEAAIKRDNRVAGPGDLPDGEELRGNPVVCGYVTAKHKKARTGHFKGEVIIYVLEDEHGAIEFRVSSKNPKLSTRLKDGVQKGDYISISGWCAFEEDMMKEKPMADCVKCGTGVEFYAEIPEVVCGDCACRVLEVMVNDKDSLRAAENGYDIRTYLRNIKEQNGTTG
jgi:DNA polymerase-3 subunit alpha